MTYDPNFSCLGAAGADSITETEHDGIARAATSGAAVVDARAPSSGSSWQPHSGIVGPQTRVAGMRVADRPAARPSHKANTLVAWTLFLGLTGFFFLTAPKSSASSDPLLNSISAWTLATGGSLVLEGHESLLDPGAFLKVTWVVPGTRGPMSIFPPGVALLAAPFYLVVQSSTMWTTTLPSGLAVTYPLPVMAPAALAAAAATALAITLLFVLLSRVGNRKAALVGALVFAFGTGAWSVASQALWQHGPAMMWIALGLLYPSPAVAGAAWIPAILTRPLVGVIPSITAGYQAITERRWRGLLLPGISTAIGVALFISFNRWAFGSWSPFAAYETNPVLTLGDPSVFAWLTNIAGALADPRRGLFIISPFLLALIPGVRSAWRSAPTWVKGAALGGIGYLLVQYKTHPYLGGDWFFGYRYPLEGLMALAPLSFLSYQTWVRQHQLARWLFWLGVVVAAGLQAWAVLNPYEF